MDKQQFLKELPQYFEVDLVNPFKKYPDFIAIEHVDNHKWFGLLMEVEADKLKLDTDDKVLILNVKLPPEEVEFLRNDAKFLPAYHMNKEHWISIRLDVIQKFSDILDLLQESFNLTEK